MYSIGIDIGGMSIKVGVVDKNGNIVAKNRSVTVNDTTQTFNNVVNQIDSLLLENNININNILGIGIGVPGFCDSKNLIIENLSNIGWGRFPLGAMLKEKYKVKVAMSNDANVALIGEVIYGSAKGFKDCVMFTLGTGVGGGAVIDGKLFEGGYSKGTEFGHTTLILGGEPCSCGRRGCLEKYASATALISQTKMAMNSNMSSKMWDFVNGDINAVDGRTAFECSKIGDQSAMEVVEKYVEYLSEGILSALNVFRPEIFLLGGGVSAQGDYLINKITEYCEKYNYGYKGAPKTIIKTAILGNDAGIMGASALVL